MSTWVLASFLILATVVAGVVLWRRRTTSAHAVPFSELTDISDPQGHYALAIVGDVVPADQPAFVPAGHMRLGLFSLVPQPTRFDRRAVRVYFGPHAVGTLSRADSRAYRSQYGTRPSRCRGLLGLDIVAPAPAHAVWLDANLGSAAAAASAALLAPALASVFPIVLSKDEYQVQALGDLMRNRPACIIDAQVAMSGDQAVVRAGGSNVGHLPAEITQAFSRTHGQASVGTQAYVRPGPEGPEVRLLANQALRSLI